MTVQLGDFFILKGTTGMYRVIDIIGNTKYIPAESGIVFLQLTNKPKLWQTLQNIISIPERSIDLVFDKIKET